MALARDRFETDAGNNGWHVICSRPMSVSNNQMLQWMDEDDDARDQLETTELE